ncbi:carbon-nitrogen hydrolase family protein [Dinghuibacter silviterrae]|uniref:Putative amidohydrolase n=1 Tax=Dinghuibacter silviterrae TaxID=1539049 RepID=A0A4R8DQ51_9BACT|nr:carbon-nitrogen hydrolase family protein [Dinghuibacter silviterrae]TDW99250.1 putative amidohydrolase [Dinghuibacter silviterrae]
MRIALASPPFPSSIAEALSWLDKQAGEASAAGAELVCFPETFIPGYPFGQHTTDERTPEQLKAALEKAGAIAKAHRIALIVPMDWYEGAQFLNVAFVINNSGEVLGYQTKNQLDPSEDTIWQAGTERRLFEIDGLRFGITICHEGFRYPESVRWAARRGAGVVFHPHANGSETTGVCPKEWGSMDSPYYEKAIMMRALENTIFFASSNYGTAYPESASAVIAPDGTCLIHSTYGRPGVIVADIDPLQATGLLANRFKPDNYPY